MAFWIVTDVAGDLPQTYIDGQKNFLVMPMPYCISGKDAMYKPYDGSDTLHQLYERMRAGEVVTTAQVSLADYQTAFKTLIDAGHEVVYIGFSSGLSGSFQTAVLARSMILEEKPDAKLFVVDSMCASFGEGLLVHYALQKRAEGLDAQAVAAWVQDNRQRLIHWFTVDDLDFLYRGGRVSKSSAFLGGMLQIKPVLHVNFEGKLIPREKVAGRKRSLKALAEKYVEFARPKEGQTVFISHGDCEADAQYTADLLRKLVPSLTDIVIAPIGVIIGAHSGPGTLAIFFLGDGR